MSCLWRQVLQSRSLCVAGFGIAYNVRNGRVLIVDENLYPNVLLLACTLGKFSLKLFPSLGPLESCFLFCFFSSSSFSNVDDSIFVVSDQEHAYGNCVWMCFAITL